MTAATDEPRRSNRALMLTGHYSWVFLAVLVPVSLSSVFTGQHYWELNLAGALCMTLWFAALFVADKGYHDARLCERCIAATPLNPQASVDRWRRFLRLEHATGTQFGVFMVIFGLDIFLVWRHSWLSNVSDVLVLVLLTLMYSGEYIHRRLYPWCPWCHWDDGGDVEVSPDVPAPTVSR